jgi:hypothetical protein
MPDNSTKTCTACGLAFSLLRRRHHCRVCGKIFCQACSSQTANVGNEGHVRVCDNCFSSARGGGLNDNGIRKGLPPSRKSIPQQRGTARGTRAIDENGNATVDEGLRSPLYGGQTTNDSASMNIGNGKLQNTIYGNERNRINPFGAGGGGIGVGDDRQRLQRPTQPLFSVPATPNAEKLLHSLARIGDAHLRNTVERAIAYYFPELSMESTSFPTRQSPGQGVAWNTSTPLKSQIDSDAIFSRGLSKDQQAWADMILKLARRAITALDPNIALGDRADARVYIKIKKIPDPVLLPNLSSHQFQSPENQASMQVSENKNHYQNNDQGNFKSPATPVSAFPPGSSSLKTPSVSSHSSITRIGACQLVAGVVFRRNLSHKGMRSEIKDPRVLLLDDALEFDGGTGGTSAVRFSHFGTLIEQERKYTELLVEHVLVLRPDVILVSRSVSRLALELLLENNVTVIPNVKYVTLQRVSRASGARILPSLYALDKMSPDEIIGTTAGHFAARSVLVSSSNSGAVGTNLSSPITYETTSSSSSSSVSLFSSPSSLSSSRSMRSSYIVFEDCPEHLGCTVLLRGRSEDLARIKMILRHAVYVAWNLRLQTAYFFDSYIRGPDCTLLSLSHQDNRFESEATPHAEPLSGTFPYLRPQLLQKILHFDSGSRLQLLRAFLLLPSSPMLESSNIEALAIRLAEKMDRVAGKSKGVSSSSFDVIDSAPLPLASLKTLVNLLQLNGIGTIEDTLSLIKTLGGRAPLPSFLDPIALSEQAEAITVTCCYLSVSSGGAEAGKQCRKPQPLTFRFFDHGDWTLGKFLSEWCFSSENSNSECRSCGKERAFGHIRSFALSRARVDLEVKELPYDANMLLQRGRPSPHTTPPTNYTSEKNGDIVTYSYCSTCDRRLALSRLSRGALALPFGKVLQEMLLGSSSISADTECPHCPNSQHHVRYFQSGKVLAMLRIYPLIPLQIDLQSRAPISNLDWVKSTRTKELRTLADAARHIFNRTASLSSCIRSCLDVGEAVTLSIESACVEAIDAAADAATREDENNGSIEGRSREQSSARTRSLSSSTAPSVDDFPDGASERPRSRTSSRSGILSLSYFSSQASQVRFSFRKRNQELLDAIELSEKALAIGSDASQDADKVVHSEEDDVLAAFAMRRRWFLFSSNADSKFKKLMGRMMKAGQAVIDIGDAVIESQAASNLQRHNDPPGFQDHSKLSALRDRLKEFRSTCKLLSSKTGKEREPDVMNTFESKFQSRGHLSLPSGLSESSVIIDDSIVSTVVSYSLCSNWYWLRLKELAQRVDSYDKEQQQLQSPLNASSSSNGPIGVKPLVSNNTNIPSLRSSLSTTGASSVSLFPFFGSVSKEIPSSTSLVTGTVESPTEDVDRDSDDAKKASANKNDNSIGQSSSPNTRSEAEADGGEAFDEGVDEGDEEEEEEEAEEEEEEDGGEAEVDVDGVEYDEGAGDDEVDETFVETNGEEVSSSDGGIKLHDENQNVPAKLAVEETENAASQTPLLQNNSLAASLSASATALSSLEAAVLPQQNTQSTKAITSEASIISSGVSVSSSIGFLPPRQRSLANPFGSSKSSAASTATAAPSAHRECSHASMSSLFGNFGKSPFMSPADALKHDPGATGATGAGFTVHSFADKSSSFTVTSLWALQFHALRQLYLGKDGERAFAQSLACSSLWTNASGGKSGAKFEKTLDGRFVTKLVSKTEFDMFVNHIAPDYLKHMHGTLVNKLPSLLIKILGVFKVQIQVHNKGGSANNLQGLSGSIISTSTGITPIEGGKNVIPSHGSTGGGNYHDNSELNGEIRSFVKQTHFVIVMENLFHGVNLLPGTTFDLKGKTRSQKKPSNIASGGSMSSTNVVSGLISRRSETSSAPLSPIQFGDIHNPFFFQQQQQKQQQQQSDLIASLANFNNEQVTPQSLQFESNIGTSSNTSTTIEASSAPVVDVDGTTNAFHLERMSPSPKSEKEDVIHGAISRSGSVATLESVALDSKLATALPENAETNIVSSSTDNLVLFDSDLMSWTRGFPLPLTDAAKRHLDAALRRDCDFLSEAEIIDYSLLVGVDIESGQIRIGIVDYLRRFDIVKRVENRVKAVAQLATNVEPTVVQPSRYGERLLRASERYFMSVRQNVE